MMIQIIKMVEIMKNESTYTYEPCSIRLFSTSNRLKIIYICVSFRYNAIKLCVFHNLYSNFMIICICVFFYDIVESFIIFQEMFIKRFFFLREERKKKIEKIFLSRRTSYYI